MISPQNVHKHEFIGLMAEVVRSGNKTQEGIHGLIVDETKNTFLIQTNEGIKCVQKQYMLLRVALPDSVVVIIDCSKLSVSPTRRVKLKS